MVVLVCPDYVGSRYLRFIVISHAMIYCSHKPFVCLLMSLEVFGLIFSHPDKWGLEYCRTVEPSTSLFLQPMLTSITNVQMRTPMGSALLTRLFSSHLTLLGNFAHECHNLQPDQGSSTKCFVLLTNRNKKRRKRLKALFYYS